MTPRWLWDCLLLGATLAAIAALALIVALALGWNSPRPGRPPSWEAPALPYRLAAEPGAASLSLLAHPAGDFTFEVMARPLAGPDLCTYGLVYRAQDAAHYYLFAVGTDGYYAVLKQEGEDVTPLVTWQQFPHVERGQSSNRLLVTCTGPSCTFRINDEYAVTVEDDRWLSGDVGFWAQSIEEEAVLQFRSARLWRPPLSPPRRGGDRGATRPIETSDRRHVVVVGASDQLARQPLQGPRQRRIGRAEGQRLPLSQCLGLIWIEGDDARQ